MLSYSSVCYLCLLLMYLFAVASLFVSVIWTPYTLYHPISISFLQLLLDARHSDTDKGAGGVSD